MQYSIHPPSPFIVDRLEQLLPDWGVPVRSVLVVLQRSSLPLTEKNRHTETQKSYLRQRFLELGQWAAAALQSRGHRVEVFDPQTGLPLLSRPGKIPLDDVRVVHTCLGYPAIPLGECRAIVHPVWGSAVYPSVLVSSASPDLLGEILRQGMHRFDGVAGMPPLPQVGGEFDEIEGEDDRLG